MLQAVKCSNVKAALTKVKGYQDAHLNLSEPPCIPEFLNKQQHTLTEQPHYKSRKNSVNLSMEFLFKYKTKFCYML